MVLVVHGCFGACAGAIGTGGAAVSKALDGGVRRREAHKQFADQ